MNLYQWGSEIWPFEIWKHLKSVLFEGRISNGPVFKWSGFGYGYSYSPNYLKTGPLEIQTFLSRFKWFLTEWWPFVQISNGWASVFQIPFEICTIWNPTSFWPFKIQTSREFRSPLYLQCRSIFNSILPDCWSVLESVAKLQHQQQILKKYKKYFKLGIRILTLRNPKIFKYWIPNF